MTRHIRVHIAGLSTFILVVRDGVVAEVSLALFRDFLFLSEREAADKLRALGATFVDMDKDQSIVEVRRGYRSRDRR